MSPAAIWRETKNVGANLVFAPCGVDVMDQNELRQWEERCIQEEPPECTAACPFHVDVRAFMGHAREGRWPGAWQVLARTLPLTALLGRVCDAPCRARCKRGEVGDAIRIGVLERACVAQAGGVYHVMLLPSKGKNIAVFGSGWSSLTVAWDLVRKGYGVTILEPGDAPGAKLADRHAGIITVKMVTQELDWLRKWGVHFETGIELDSQASLTRALDQFDAVYAGLDGMALAQWELPRDSNGVRQFDPKFFTTANPRIFTAGSGDSTIWLAAQGRFAATSIDRTLQKVSINAGREKEGAHPTRLYTSLQGVEPKRAIGMANPTAGYSTEEAVAEAGRCLMCECMECVKVCPFLEKFGAFPRKYAREIFNNESMFMGARTANTMINSCSLCGLCEEVCPQDFAMQNLCLQARRSMVEREKMPPSAHEFALADMAFSQGEEFFMVRHAPGDDRSSHLFFPGCQLCASAPEQVRSLYAYLRKNIEGGVGLALGCCGAPAHWAGREEESEAVIALLRQHWQALGHPKLITACSTCQRMFQEFWPQAPVESIWETLEVMGLPEVKSLAKPLRLALHDPCTTRHTPAVQATVRKLASRLGVEIEELALAGPATECCGYGGLMENANPQLAGEVIRRRSSLSSKDYLAYCAMCRDALASAGKRSLHLLDLIFPASEENDPAGRPRPGWSQKRENRAGLKRAFLKDLWGEDASMQEDDSKLKLSISTKVQRMLDERLILMEDLRRVIAHAEKSGQKLCHPETGRFKAAHRPKHITFWVEYEKKGAAIEVINAYAHRMEVHRS